MSNRQLTKWLGYYSPLFRGRFDFHRGEDAPRMDSWCNALSLFGGRFWVRIMGGHNLRRSTTSRIPQLFDPIIGTCDGPRATLTTNWLVGHAASSRYLYRVTSVGGGGVEDDGRNAVREVETDADTKLTGALPNRIADLAIEPQSDGTYVLRWTYCATAQAIAPTTFRIYSDSGTGTMDYVTPISSVAYVSGVPTYTYTTPVLAGATDTLCKFVIRAEAASGAREQNELVVASTARTTAPYGTVPSWSHAEGGQKMILPYG